MFLFKLFIYLSCLLIYFKSVCRAPHWRVEVRQSRTAKKLGIIFGRSCNLLSSLLISELVDKCIGSRIHIVMKTDKEIVGTLLGFDDFVSILCKEQRRSFVFATSLFCLSMCFKRVDPRVTHTSCWNVYVSSQCCNFWLSLVYIMYRLEIALIIVLWLSLLDMVLEDVTELYVHFYLSIYYFLFFLTNGLLIQCKSMLLISHLCFSEITPEGRRITKLDQILLNGNNITMVREESIVVFSCVMLVFCSS